MPDYEYLILGSGIASFSLVHSLESRGLSYHIIGSRKQAASLAADAVINPVTGRRLVKTWLAEQAISYAEEFYRDWEKKLNASFFRPIKIYKPITNNQVENAWLSRSAEELKNWISPQLTSLLFPKDTEISCLEICKAWHIQPEILFNSYLKYLAVKGCFSERMLTINDVQMICSEKQWENMRFGKIVFCRGFTDAMNGPFSYLPFRPAKGEALLVKKSFDFDHLVGGNTHLCSYDENRFFIGSSFDYNLSDTIANEQTKMLLLNNIRKLIPEDFFCVEHLVGVRPAVKDYRPLCGRHPGLPSVFLYNGFGTKGYSLAPYFAKIFIDYCEGLEKLPAEIDIKRFESAYVA